MTARIYLPVKNPMQSGKAHRHWLLEFEPEDTRFNEPIMGWVGNTDMKQELRMWFPTKEAAVEYAKAHNIPYEVIEPKKAKTIIKSYADNFKPDTSTPRQGAQ